MYRQDVKEEKDPVPCHGRHGIDAAGAKDGTGKKGPWKRMSGRNSDGEEKDQQGGETPTTKE